MTRRRISETLVVESKNIVCVSCGYLLAPSATPWKAKAKLTTVPLTGMPGAASAINPRVVLRRFSCPGCGALLDTETALPEDPFLEDVVQVS